VSAEIYRGHLFREILSRITPFSKFCLKYKLFVIWSKIFAFFRIFFFTYNVNYSNPFTGKAIFNLLHKKTKFSQLYNLHIYRFITFKLPISIEREKYYSATGRDSLCRSNRIAVIVRRFIVIRRLPQEQNYALPRFVMFSRYQAMRFVAKYSWQLPKAAEKKRVSPKFQRCSIKEPFIADRIHGACLRLRKLARR